MLIENSTSQVIGAHSGAKGVYIVPGVNDIKSEDWNSVSERFSGDKRLLAIAPKGSKKTDSEITEFTGEEFESIVSRTVYIPYLIRWKGLVTKESDRMSVLRRIEALENYK